MISIDWDRWRATDSRSAPSMTTYSPFATSQPLTSSSASTSRSWCGHQRFCLMGVPHSRWSVRNETSVRWVAKARPIGMLTRPNEMEPFQIVRMRRVRIVEGPGLFALSYGLPPAYDSECDDGLPRDEPDRLAARPPDGARSLAVRAGAAMAGPGLSRGAGRRLAGGLVGRGGAPGRGALAHAARARSAAPGRRRGARANTARVDPARLGDHEHRGRRRRHLPDEHRLRERLHPRPLRSGTRVRRGRGAA